MSTVLFILICWLLVSIIAGLLFAPCINSSEEFPIESADREPTPLGDYWEARR